MPKDPKRNIQSYQIQGGHLNEFEFQKSQSEMAEESELPFSNETDQPNPTQAEHVAAVTAEAHRKVEKRNKRGIAKAGGGQYAGAAQRSSKKVARKAAKNTAARTGAKKRGQRIAVAKKAAKKAAKKVAGKSAKKTTKRAGTKKPAKVKSRGQQTAARR